MRCLKMIVVRQKNGQVNKVPCGKCGFCLTNKRSQWAFRIQQEMKYQLRPGWFVTLTYDERHVQRVRRTGELSLRFRDVQLFFKRLRRDKYYCKYVCVGEYGAETKRPHYHMLLWTDCPVEKLESYWYWQYKDGHREQMGKFHVGRLTMASAMYTLKYIMQPKVRDEDVNLSHYEYEERREKTRAQFSRGIGLDYLSCAMYDYLTDDYESPVMVVVVDGRKVALPRYYKSKIYTKYQMRVEAHRNALREHKEWRKLKRELGDQGMSWGRIEQYVQGLRIEQSLRIISKTKVNQSI